MALKGCKQKPQCGFQKGNRLWDNPISRAGGYQKGFLPWNKGLTKKTDPRVAINGIHVGEALLGKKQSEETIKRRLKSLGMGSNWRGDKVGYSGIHIWLNKEFGLATNYVCKCGRQAKHWANLNGIYERNRNNFEPMCVSCHRLYDYRRNNRKSK